MAAETVVLPTPPLPMLKESGVSSAGHLAFLSLGSGLLAGRFPAMAFLFPNTCCENRNRSCAPAMGAPTSSAIFRVAFGKLLLMKLLAERVLRAVSPQRRHLLAATMARFKTTSVKRR